jgi:Na+/H+ antiporter NhaD/arsenite permease-like protein
MATTLLIVVFILGYLAIAFEHPLKIDKAASALLTGILCWVIYVFTADEFLVNTQLFHAFGDIAEILFFLLGAMVIVEMVDAFEGFSIITDKITATNKVKLLWILGFITFFLSAVLDNLTTTIVMISLLRKLVDDKNDRLLYAGMIVIAANAGGAWTVTGDVTTTMLWIKGKISVFAVMKTLLLPSLICLLVPLLILSFRMKGHVSRPVINDGEENVVKPFHKNLIFILGVGGLLFVPVFKTFTHLPPFMGILFSLGILWLVSEIINPKMDMVARSSTRVVSVLKNIDTSSILFFLGILLAVGSLGATGLLQDLASKLDIAIGDKNAIAVLIGFASAVVDNVPLVAAGMEMYAMPLDDSFWQFLAYCAGTGGSCLVIGSAAGVAAMGMEKIDFMWYLKKIAPLAIAGYLAGAAVYLCM